MIIPCASCGASNRVPAKRATQRALCGSCKKPISPLSHAHPVPSVDEFEEIVGQSPLPVLVDFWAPWCGPCRVVAPEIEKLARTRTGALVVAKVNADELPAVAARFGVRGIPTLILFREGHEAKRVSGAMSADNLAAALGL